MDNVLLPTTNADDFSVVPMTEEQKYIFDLKGWICLPGLLTEEQLEPIREYQLAFLHDRESLPAEERDNHGGPSQILADHPAVVEVLNEIISNQRLATEECYGFRYDHTYTSHRPAGHDNFRPHGGGGFFNFCGSSHIYQFTCYNTVNEKWGKGCPTPEVIAAMPPKRQTLFRGVWHGMREVPKVNRYYEGTNRAV